VLVRLELRLLLIVELAEAEAEVMELLSLEQVEMVVVGD
jgi:hypothetical protein